MAYNTAEPRAEYSANAGQTEFDFVFKIFLTSDLKVFLTPFGQISNDDTDILTENVDYTVSINGDNGGTMTLINPASENDTLVLIRDLPVKRDYEYQQGGDLSADTLNDDQDYQTYIMSDKESDNNRFLEVPKSAIGVQTKLPPIIPNKFLKWNAEGSEIEYATISPDDLLYPAIGITPHSMTIEYLKERYVSKNNDLYISTTGTDESPNVGNDPFSDDDNWSAIGLTHVTTMAKFRSLKKAPKKVWLTGYHTKNDGAFGSNFYRLKGLKTTEIDNGGTVIIITMGGVDYVYELQYNGIVAIKWFGAKRLEESTIAVQSAFNYVASFNGTIEIDDLYLVDTIKVTGVNGFAMTGKGALIGNATTTRDAVLEFKNCTDVTATKTLTISGSYNENYTAGVKVWAEISTGTSSLNVLKFNIVGAKLAWQFGDLSEPDVLLSEMSIGEGYTYGCPECLLVIGTQAVIGVTDYQLISGTSGGTGTWLTLPRNVIRTIGGRVQVNGGEVILTDVITGVTCNIQPIDSTSFDNSYGKVIMSNVEIESSSQLLVTSNPNNILNTTKGLFDLSQCGGYHSQNAFSFMQTDIDFIGEVVVKQCDFYGAVARTQPTLQCYGNANVYIDDISFKTNFVQGLGAISGGIVHFTYRMILNANNLVGQTLTSGAATTLVFASKVSDIDLNRFTLDYNALTGVFTVPTGGLKNIKIETQLLKAGLGGEWYVQINGSSYGIRELGNYSHNSYSINSLNAGDTIKIVLLNLSATTVATSAYLDYFQIFASN